MLLTGVVAALEYGEIQQIGGFDPQPFEDRLAQGGRGTIEGQRQFGDANHGGVLAGDSGRGRD